MILKQKQFDLQERLINFAVMVIRLARELSAGETGKLVKGQILRSGTSSAPNYGEAQSAESRADFIHKIKIALKELRETDVWLRIIVKAELVKPTSKVGPVLTECNELISILVQSVNTARANQRKDKRS